MCGFWWLAQNLDAIESVNSRSSGPLHGCSKFGRKYSLHAEAVAHSLVLLLALQQQNLAERSEAKGQRARVGSRTWTIDLGDLVLHLQFCSTAGNLW